MGQKRRISFIGSGNVAWQLSHALDQAGHTIHQVISRKEENAKALAKKFGAYFNNDLGMLYKQIDLLIIAVSDDSIPLVANELAGKQIPTAHTSGSVNLNALAPIGSDTGVIYPLQSFSKEAKLDFRSIPFLIEGSNGQTVELLKDVASDLSDNVEELNSEKRKKLHMSAVMVNNFSNHLFHLADEYLKKEGIPFKHLRPLIQETTNRLNTATPFEAQTGPAKRNDQGTMNSHLELLKDDPQLRELYRIISDSITKSHM